MKLEIRHLAHFNNELKRDILADALASPVRMPDQDLLMRVIEYGNTFLERHKGEAEDAGCIIWFDVHFGEPAVIGMSWSYNPNAPYDDLYGVPEFWRIWSENRNLADGKSVYTLQQCQSDIADYQMQHLVKG
jgi:hypothetical protein